MCSIAGWVDYNLDLTKKKDILKQMNEVLAHRGPDAFGVHITQNAALLHNRLAVIDIELGKQPMSREHGGESYTICYNGELYNTLELRQDLEKKGHNFKTSSDTEVLLVSFIEYGEKCLDKLNGIFAFAVWQKNAQKLFIARDKMGVKPLFYKKTKSGIIFSSEIKALFKNPYCRPVLDKDGINQIFLLVPGRIGGSGVYKDIQELKAGECLTLTKNSFNKKQYFSFKAKPHFYSLTETIDMLRYLVFDAIERQLVSDVPLATFLSGGLDSSIISYVAAKKYKIENKQLSTFSVDFEGNDKNFVKNDFQPDSDTRYINLMSEFINSKHTQVLLKNTAVVDNLKTASLARDLAGMADIDSSLLLFGKEVKKTHTVALSGECADEFFGGYPWFFNNTSDNTFPWARSLDLRKSICNKEFLFNNADDFVIDLYNQTLRETDYLTSDSLENKRQRELFNLNYKWFMQTLLDRKDRMSMQGGLEARVPFCDYRLAEFAYNIPWELKAYKGREKGLLREAFKDILPTDIVFRKKSPYPKTFDPLYFEAVKKLAKNAVESGGVVSQIIDKKVFYSLLELEPEKATPWYGQLMRLPQVFGMLYQLDCICSEYGVVVS